MPQPRAQPEVLRLPLHRAGESADPRTRTRGRARGLLVVLAVLFACAAVPARAALRAVFAGLAAFAALPAVVVRRRRAKREATGWVTADAAGVTRVEADGAARPLAEWGVTFGVTVLANAARSEGLLAFTTAEQTRFVRVQRSRTDDVGRAAARELFHAAPIALDVDVFSGGATTDGALDAEDALRLLQILRGRAAGALDRILLSDARGTPVVLDGDELRLGERIFDLRAPIEWRGFMFFESAGPMSTVVQATWIRQSGHEAVLVAPMPAALGGVKRALGGDVDAERIAARDLRLLQAAPDVPPPAELRLAIERLFMVPLRSALDRAPRMPRMTPKAERREGRAS